MSHTSHTPGPWSWELNVKSRRLCLVSNGLPASMHEFVMDFVRWGFSGAAPRFRKPSPSRPSLVLMHRVEEFAKPINGREHHSDWFQNVDHPDARLIAAAPDLLAACQSLITEARDVMNSLPGIVTGSLDDALNGADAAIAKALGTESEVAP